MPRTKNVKKKFHRCFKILIYSYCLYRVLSENVLFLYSGFAVSRKILAENGPEQDFFNLSRFSDKKLLQKTSH